MNSKQTYHAEAKDYVVRQLFLAYNDALDEEGEDSFRATAIEKTMKNVDHIL